MKVEVEDVFGPPVDGRHTEQPMADATFHDAPPCCCRHPSRVVSSFRQRCQQRIDVGCSARPSSRAKGIRTPVDTDGFLPDRESSAIHKAAHEGDGMAVAMLLNRGASVNALTSDGETPLHLAVLAATAPVAIVTFLCERHADINAPDLRDGNTALHRAAAQPAVVEVLLGKGALARAANRAGDQPLHEAAFTGSVRSLRLMLQHGALVDDPGFGGEQALAIAARRGNLDAVRFLIEKGRAPVDATDAAGYSASRLAAEGGHVDIVECLLFYRAQPSAELTSVLTRATEAARSRAAAAGTAAVNLAAALSPAWLKRVAHMPPLARALLVHHTPPCQVAARDLLREQTTPGMAALDALAKYRGAVAAVERPRARAVLHVSHALSAVQCAAVRHAVDTRGRLTIDSVDALPNRDLALSVRALEQLIGAAAARTLLELPDRFRAQCAHGDAPHAGAPSTAAPATSTTRAVRLAGSFARRYCADTSGAEQPLTSFHFDSAALTVNVALSSDATITGGRLIGVYDDGVHEIGRDEGDATVHSSGLLHAVTRMCTGTRYSLILFFALGGGPAAG